MSVESRALVLQHAVFLAKDSHPTDAEKIVADAQKFHDFLATPEPRPSGIVVPDVRPG